jgi:hypothetical protein
MSLAEVAQLPLNQKLQIMEAIWEDLRSRAESFDIPPRDKALLEERRARAARGEAAILDWDEVKHTIGRA